MEADQGANQVRQCDPLASGHSRDDAVRLQAIRAKRWITHHPAARVLAALQEAMEQPAGDRMENLLLIAKSGMSKTMLLRKFQRDMPRPSIRQAAYSRIRLSSR
jgi:hypothetical protein